jgi:hypothetical protein
LANVKTKIDRLNTAFADGSLEMDEFKEMKNPLVPTKTGLEQKLAELERSKLNRLEPLKTFIFEANQAQKWVKEENWQEMRAYLKKHGLNRILCAQTLTVTFKKPASLLAETVLDVQRTKSVESLPITCRDFTHNVAHDLAKSATFSTTCLAGGAP